MFEQIRRRRAPTKHLYAQRPAYIITEQELVWMETASEREAVRLLGFALFNLNKQKPEAAETLVRKAYVALTGTEWDS